MEGAVELLIERDQRSILRTPEILWPRVVVIHVDHPSDPALFHPFIEELLALGVREPVELGLGQRLRLDRSRRADRGLPLLSSLQLAPLALPLLLVDVSLILFLLPPRGLCVPLPLGGFRLRLGLRRRVRLGLRWLGWWSRF